MRSTAARSSSPRIGGARDRVERRDSGPHRRGANVGARSEELVDNLGTATARRLVEGRRAGRSPPQIRRHAAREAPPHEIELPAARAVVEEQSGRVASGAVDAACGELLDDVNRVELLAPVERPRVRRQRASRGSADGEITQRKKPLQNGPRRVRNRFEDQRDLVFARALVGVGARREQRLDGRRVVREHGVVERRHRVVPRTDGLSARLLVEVLRERAGVVADNRTDERRRVLRREQPRDRRRPEGDPAPRAIVPERRTVEVIFRYVVELPHTLCLRARGRRASGPRRHRTVADGFSRLTL